MADYPQDPETLKVIKTRRSIRKYLNTPVEWDNVLSIIECARHTPSSGNIQNFRFIVVTDQGKRSRLAEACLNQDWMAEAPVHIVIVADLTLAKQYYGEKGEKVYSLQNCAAAAQTMLLTATALGLGSCWVGAFDNEMVKNLFGIPEYAEPQMVITIGHPNEQVANPPTYTMETMTFFEGWGSRLFNAGFNPLGYFRFGEIVQKNLGKMAKGLGKMTKSASKKIKKNSKKKE